MGSTFAQLREGIAFIRANPQISWSLTYLGIAASLIGVLGVLGTKFAIDSLGLDYKDFVVVVLPLGFGIVTGILMLNTFGHLVPRRRIIEGGLVALGILLVLIVSAGPIARFLQGAEGLTGVVALADFTSLLAIVVAIALLAGIAYAFVAIPSQTQLQEDIPEDTRGRVFGVLNMLVSIASFLPIIIVGPLVRRRRHARPCCCGSPSPSPRPASLSIVDAGSAQARGGDRATAHGPAAPAGLDPVAVATASELDAGERRAERAPAVQLDAAEPPSAPPTEAANRRQVTSANGEDAPVGRPRAGPARHRADRDAAAAPRARAGSMRWRSLGAGCRGRPRDEVLAVVIDPAPGTSTSRRTRWRSPG